MDFDPVNDLETFSVDHFRADNNHIVSSIPKSEGFLPYSPVEWNRQIFDKDQNSSFSRFSFHYNIFCKYEYLARKLDIYPQTP